MEGSAPTHRLHALDITTGAERPAKLRRSGHQVSFHLTVIDSCTGAARHYTGTDTVRGGKIVAVHVTRTS